MNRTVKTIIFFLVVIGMIWLVILLFTKAFSTGSKGTAPQKVDVMSYASTDAAASMYIDGPVQSNQEHLALQITVDKNQVSAVLYSGYEGNVVKQQVYQNNITAYKAFLASLEKAGFGSPVATSIGSDERGYCPLRNRFIYSLNNAGSTVYKTWTTSCGIGNYKGQLDLTRTLFLQQVPQNDLRDILVNSGFLAS